MIVITISIVCVAALCILLIMDTPEVFDRPNNEAKAIGITAAACKGLSKGVNRGRKY